MKKIIHYIVVFFVILASPFLYAWDLFKKYRNGRKLIRAKYKAYQEHLFHNGRRYFVLEVDIKCRLFGRTYRPGDFLVADGSMIKEMQRVGVFSKDATIKDFLVEAKYITPSSTIWTNKENPFWFDTIPIFEIAVFVVVVLSVGMFLLR